MAFFAGLTKILKLRVSPKRPHNLLMVKLETHPKVSLGFWSSPKRILLKFLFRTMIFTHPASWGWQFFLPHYKNPRFTHWIHSILSLLFSSTGDISRVNLEFWSPWLQPRPRCLPRMLKKPKAPRFYCTNKRWRGPQGGAESSGKWPWSEFLG